jgi:hypothetical protein
MKRDWYKPVRRALKTKGAMRVEDARKLILKGFVVPPAVIVDAARARRFRIKLAKQQVARNMGHV